jgi:hypothetical protein
MTESIEQFLARHPRLIKTDRPNFFAFPRPPDGFRAAEATDAELVLYGFPISPRGTPGQQIWKRAISLPMDYTGPQFVTPPRFQSPLGDIGHAAALRTGMEAGGDINDFNWAGPGVQQPLGSQAYFNNVWGTWVVPSVYLPKSVGVLGDQPLLWALLTWVGIDGDPSITPGNGIIQVGTGQAVLFTPGGDPLITTSYFAWWQGDPNLSLTEIQQIPINPGDSIVANVTFNQADNSASFWIANESLERYFAGTIALGGNLPNSGMTAEWIFEAPTNTNNGAIIPLPTFAAGVFTNAYAEDSALAWWAASDPAGSIGSNYTQNIYTLDDQQTNDPLVNTAVSVPTVLFSQVGVLAA